MKERPILFSGEMIRAILDGRKTQTRRVIHKSISECITDNPENYIYRCPYGQPGDRLWVRETWMPFDVLGFDDCNPRVEIGYKASNDIRPDGVSPLEFGSSKIFDISSELFNKFESKIEEYEVYGDKWNPSIFMPRWASRINLETTNIRVERLQDISEEDAKAEGIEELEFESFTEGTQYMYGLDVDSANSRFVTDNPITSYRELWEKINGTGSWDKNPWVWVVEFRRMS